MQYLRIIKTVEIEQGNNKQRDPIIKNYFNSH